MSSNNTIVVVGRAVDNAEIRNLPSGMQVANFKVAVNRTRKDKEGNYKADFFTVQAWGKSADLAGNLISKGSLISVSGQMHIDTEKKGEVWHTYPKINMSNFQVLSSKKNSEQSQTRQEYDNYQPDSPAIPLPDDYSDDTPPF